MQFGLRTLLLVVAIAAVVIAALAPKPDRYEYQCSDGGPHIVIPNAVADAWNGGRVDPFASDADYSRVCDICEDNEDWFYIVDVGDAEALVIDNPPFIAWDRSSTISTHYFFKLDAWGGAELDDVLDRAKAIHLQPTNKIWHVPDGGAFMIHAADGPEGDYAGRIDTPSLEGTYRVSTGRYEQGFESARVLRLDRIP